MTVPRPRVVLLATTIALATALLVPGAAPSARAAAVAPPVVRTGGYDGLRATALPGATCAGTAIATVPLSPIASDGAPVTLPVSRNAIVTDGAALTDVRLRGGVVATSALGARGGTVQVEGRISATLTPAGTTGRCAAAVESVRGVEVVVDVATPMWITARVAASESTDGGSAVVSVDGFDLRSGSRGTGEVRRLLDPGNHYLSLSLRSDVAVLAGGTAVVASTTAGRAFVDLRPAGAASASTGAARRLVVLGGRDCARGTVTARVTRAADRRARAVVVRVICDSGTRTVTLRGDRLRPRTLSLPVAAASPARVRTTVVLRDGRRVTGERSYLGCAD